MSLPEMQHPSCEGGPRGDELDQANLIFCRLHVERLLEEAQQFGSLVTTSDGDMELSVDITPSYTSDFNALGYPTNTFESVNFVVVNEERTTSYVIQHEITTQVVQRATELLKRSFFLHFYNEGGLKVMDKEVSQYKVELSNLPFFGEGSRIIPQDGDPLDDDQKESLQSSFEDLCHIKNFQLIEVTELAKRALTAVRETHLT